MSFERLRKHSDTSKYTRIAGDSMRKHYATVVLLAMSSFVLGTLALFDLGPAWSASQAHDIQLRFAGQISRPSTTQVPAGTQLAQSKTTRDASELELMFWRSIKDSQNPADFEAYLEAFPDGAFAPLARVRAGHGLPEGPKIEEVELTYRVRANANLREQPTADSQRIGGLKIGNRVLVTGRVVDRNWLRVTTEDGLKGYVFGELVEPALGEPAEAVSMAGPEPELPASEPGAAQEALEQTDVAAIPTAPEMEEMPVTDVQDGEETIVFRDCETCPEMVRLPTGSFSMGNDRGHSSERPAHMVFLRHNFAIGKYEVTVGEWNRCVAEDRCARLSGVESATEDSPLRNVSWVDAQQFVKWLSELTGKNYRLPSEAEWEYAARGGTETLYWWGDQVGASNVACRKCGGDWAREAPPEVGNFSANPFGIHDMNGNIAEWTEDCWRNSYTNATTDGSAVVENNCGRRVLRGGSWRSSNTEFLTSSSRFYYDDNVRFIENGFRVAVD